MPAVRTIAAILVAATIAVAGCSTSSSGDQPSPPSSAPNPTHAPRPPTHRTDPTPVDRQAPIYAAVLRQYLTTGDASFGGFRFPRIFVLDRAVAGVSGSGGWRAAGGAPISPAVRRAMTQALVDVGPVTFVSSANAVIVDRDRCARVRDQGILITLGIVEGVGDQVEVGVDGFVACLGARSLTYRVEPAGGGWRVAGVAAWGPVA